jgi:hypothetical protein
MIIACYLSAFLLLILLGRPWSDHLILLGSLLSWAGGFCGGWLARHQGKQEGAGRRPGD